jgi:hypothetical protein
MPADARPQAPKNRKRSLLHPPSPSAPRHAPSLGNTLRAHGVTNKSHHVCARRRGWWGVRDCFGPGTTQMPADRLPQQNGITRTDSYAAYLYESIVLCDNEIGLYGPINGLRHRSYTLS